MRFHNNFAAVVVLLFGAEFVLYSPPKIFLETGFDKNIRNVCSFIRHDLEIELNFEDGGELIVLIRRRSRRDRFFWRIRLLWRS